MAILLTVAEMLIEDDIKDGFTVKISDIAWDENNNDANNAVVIVYANTAHKGTNHCETAQGSNITLLVKRDGSIVLWGNGFNTNHPWGKWVGVQATATLGQSVTEFTYKMVPNAVLTAFTFYVNDTAVYTYDLGNVPTHHQYSIFSDLNRKCGFGFMVMDGTGNFGTGFGQHPYGTLSYTVDEVYSINIVDNDNNDNNNNNNDHNNNDNANTGDMSWIALAVAAVAVMGCATVVSTKKKSSK